MALFKAPRYPAAILLGSFLLFLVQPLVGRFILPWFGGGPAVWTACLLFFQLTLLGGYAYAHGLTRLPPRWQAGTHLMLLAISIALLPITPDANWKLDAESEPTLRILLLLSATVGVPYFALSSTAPLIQSWFTRTEPASPYRLYALSNAGSLLGLLSYPFLIEPLLGLRTQTLLWSGVYALFAAAVGWCAVVLYRRGGEVATHTENASTLAPGRSQLGFWIALSCCGSVVLLATTNQMTQYFGPIPFLWVLPLSIYLLSFIVAFDRARWYDRRFWLPLTLFGICGSVLLLYVPAHINVLAQIPLFSIALLGCCMVCHGELVRRKPAPEQLTRFYLAIAAGGALGGVFVGVVAPRVFDDYWELQIGFAATYLLLAICLLGGLASWSARRRRLAIAALAAGGAILFTLLAFSGSEAQIAKSRNFYGTLQVQEEGKGHVWHKRMLSHGRIVQGSQMLRPDLHHRPTSYYGYDTPLAALILRHPKRDVGEPLKIGAIGLGVGTLLAYGEPGDLFRIYEINPAVIELSERYFDFREKSLATEQIVPGDARNALERELSRGESGQFDLLVLDAFNGDFVPMHLATLEAFELYTKHLNERGALLAHLSSDHLDLVPLAFGVADRLGLAAAWINAPRIDQFGYEETDWVVLARDPSLLDVEGVADKALPAPQRRYLWTDDHNNLLQAVKLTLRGQV